MARWVCMLFVSLLQGTGRGCVKLPQSVCQHMAGCGMWSMHQTVRQAVQDTRASRCCSQEGPAVCATHQLCQCTLQLLVLGSTCLLQVGLEAAKLVIGCEAGQHQASAAAMSTVRRACFSEKLRQACRTARGGCWYDGMLVVPAQTGLRSSAHENVRQHTICAACSACTAVAPERLRVQHGTPARTFLQHPASLLTLRHTVCQLALHQLQDSTAGRR